MKVAVAALLILVGAAESSAPQIAGIQRLAWLQGCWESASPTTTIEENWMSPLGKSMVGVSRTVRADSLVAFETIVIREQGSRLVYEAYPSGQAPAAFHSKDIRDTAVVFENLTHDFPQRIGYRRNSSDSLTAWIEGIQNGEQRRIEFLYSRVECTNN
ncbi:MAG: DUF6265 family protein [Acidobacteriota bacterium]|nr:DUF6265 family protein [Acidobacteriota bacterium]MDH3784543.1 DUF6265 family protein [Acidobacteriota bacterium]